MSLPIPSYFFYDFSVMGRAKHNQKGRGDLQDLSTQLTSRRRVAAVVCLSTFAIAIHLHLILIQFLGWGNMIMQHVSTEGMGSLQAIDQTFSPDASCGFCDLVQTLQQAELAQSSDRSDSEPPRLQSVAVPDWVATPTQDVDVPLPRVTNLKYAVLARAATHGFPFELIQPPG